VHGELAAKAVGQRQRAAAQAAHLDPQFRAGGGGRVAATATAGGDRKS